MTGARFDRRAPGRSRLWLLGAAGIAGVLCLLWAAGVIVDVTGWAPSGGRAAPAGFTTSDVLPVPLASDVALARARSLFSTGHARDALVWLGRISPADPNRPEADRLLADIQRALLAAAGPATTDAMGTPR